MNDDSSRPRDLQFLLLLLAAATSCLNAAGRCCQLLQLWLLLLLLLAAATSCLNAAGCCSRLLQLRLLPRATIL